MLPSSPWLVPLILPSWVSPRQGLGSGSKEVPSSASLVSPPALRELLLAEKRRRSFSTRGLPSARTRLHSGPRVEKLCFCKAHVISVIFTDPEWICVCQGRRLSFSSRGWWCRGWKRSWALGLGRCGVISDLLTGCHLGPLSVL